MVFLILKALKKLKKYKSSGRKKPFKIPLILGWMLSTVMKPISYSFRFSFFILTLIVQQSARIAANEASADGINWTFSPMVDISRDPRWGRVAEGEEKILT